MSRKKVSTEKELGEALKDGVDEIEIKGDLSKKTIKLRATGNLAWAVALGFLGIAAYATYVTLGTGGASTPATGPALLVVAPTAVAILGLPATVSAVAIAVAAGGTQALTRLRNYEEVSKSETGDTLILRKR
jgi:hypothetical protein